MGASPAVEDVAAVLAAAQSALGSAAHHRMRALGLGGEDVFTSPLDLQSWLLDECPEPTGVEDLEAAPDPKFATW